MIRPNGVMNNSVDDITPLDTSHSTNVNFISPSYTKDIFDLMARSKRNQLLKSSFNSIFYVVYPGEKSLFISHIFQ